MSTPALRAAVRVIATEAEFNWPLSDEQFNGYVDQAVGVVLDAVIALIEAQRAGTREMGVAALDAVRREVVALRGDTRGEQPGEHR